MTPSLTGGYVAIDAVGRVAAAAVTSPPVEIEDDVMGLDRDGSSEGGAVTEIALEIINAGVG